MYGQTIRTTFEVVKGRREVKIECKKCGKKLKRVLTTCQTINPFNKTKSGAVKGWGDIANENDAELKRDEKKLRKDGILCSKCDA